MCQGRPVLDKTVSARGRSINCKEVFEQAKNTLASQRECDGYTEFFLSNCCAAADGSSAVSSGVKETTVKKTAIEKSCPTLPQGYEASKDRKNFVAGTDTGRGSAGDAADDSCKWSLDGVCDAGTFCNTGKDDTDCDKSTEDPSDATLHHWHFLFFSYCFTWRSKCQCQHCAADWVQ